MQLVSYGLTDSDPLHVSSAIDDFVRLLHDTYVVCVCQTIMRQCAVVFNRKAKLLTKFLRVVLEPILYLMLFWGAIGGFNAQLRTFTHVMVCISIPGENTIDVLGEQT